METILAKDSEKPGMMSKAFDGDTARRRRKSYPCQSGQFISWLTYGQVP